MSSMEACPVNIYTVGGVAAMSGLVVLYQLGGFLWRLLCCSSSSRRPGQTRLAGKKRRAKRAADSTGLDWTQEMSSTKATGSSRFEAYPDEDEGWSVLCCDKCREFESKRYDSASAERPGDARALELGGTQLRRDGKHSQWLALQHRLWLVGQDKHQVVIVFLVIVICFGTTMYHTLDELENPNRPDDAYISWLQPLLECLAWGLCIPSIYNLYRHNTPCPTIIGLYIIAMPAAGLNRFFHAMNEPKCHASATADGQLPKTTSIFLIAEMTVYLIGAIAATAVAVKRAASPYRVFAKDSNRFQLIWQKHSRLSVWKSMVSVGYADLTLFATGLLGAITAGGLGVIHQAYLGALVNELYLCIYADPVDQDCELMDTWYKYMIAVSLLCGVSYGIQLAAIGVAGTRLVGRLQRMLMAAIMEEDMAFFDKNKVGQLGSYLQSNTATIKYAVGNSLPYLIKATVETLLSAITMFIWEPQLTAKFIGLCMLPMTALAVGSWLLEDVWEAVAEAQADQGAYAVEALAGMKTILAYCQQERVKRKYSRLSHVTRKISTQGDVFVALLWCWVTSCYYGFMAWLVLSGSRSVLAGDMQLSSMVSYITVSHSLMYGMEQVLEYIPHISEGIGAGKKLFALIRRTPTVPYQKGDHCGYVKGHVRFRKVVFSYAKATNPALNEITFSAKRGQFFAFVGESGSGKSTIINLIQRFYDADSGAVEIDGVDVRELSPFCLRRSIGAVMQEPTLFDGTIADNIRFGYHCSMAEVVVAAKVANAHTFIMTLPDTYNTEMGSEGTQLSGGQKQRIAIARAMLRNPAILILDEATSALDAQSERVVQKALERARQNRTTFAVAHRLNTITTADRIFVLKKGKIIEQGTHTTLVNEGGLYAKLWSIQSEDTSSTA